MGGKESNEKVDSSQGSEEKKIVEHLPKVKKSSKWSIEKCIKAARRYSDLDSWKQGSPSSFKSAHAHGWLDQCAQHFQGRHSQKLRKTA